MLLSIILLLKNTIVDPKALNIAKSCIENFRVITMVHVYAIIQH